MHRALLALAVLAAPLFTAQTADACAMRRRPPQIKMVVAKADLEEARKAEARGETATAVRLYERVMNGDRDIERRAEAALAAARLHQAAGKTGRAVNRARRAAGFAPRSAEAQLLVGELLVGRETARALTHLKKAAVLGVVSADDARLSLATARAYADLGRPEQARAHLSAAKAAGGDPAEIAAVERSLAPQKLAARI